jgi:hypothetical protein
VLTWAEIALLLLRLAQMAMTMVNDATQAKSGTDAEIAKEAAAILVKTQAGKAIMQQVTGMTDAQVDASLRGLEP